MRVATMASIMALIAAPAAGADAQIERTIARQVRAIVPADGAGGVAVALRIEGRTLFFNYGWADPSDQRPITSDSIPTRSVAASCWSWRLRGGIAHDKGAHMVRLEPLWWCAIRTAFAALKPAAADLRIRARAACVLSARRLRVPQSARA